MEKLNISGNDESIFLMSIRKKANLKGVSMRRFQSQGTTRIGKTKSIMTETRRNIMKTATSVVKILTCVLAFVFVFGFLFVNYGNSQVDLDNMVSEAKRLGYVQKAELGKYGMTMYVRPAFHELNFDTKRGIAALFLQWGQKQQPNMNYELIMIRDSRNNKVIGNYDPRLGLTLE